MTIAEHSAYTTYTPARIDAAIKTHHTIFFDADLNPVVPEEGQWFCEFEQVTPEEGDAFIRDESLVEYCGACPLWQGADSPEIIVHRVFPEYADCDRPTYALFLVRQS